MHVPWPVGEVVLVLWSEKVAVAFPDGDVPLGHFL
jgi:hypothetical protein